MTTADVTFGEPHGEALLHSTHDRIPGPASSSPLGWRARVLSLLRDPVLGLLRLRRQYGDVVALGSGNGAPVCAFSPTLNHQILTDPDLFYSLDVSDSESPIHMPIGDAPARLLSGVAGMNGPRHREHRRLLLPGFKRDHVTPLRDTMVACIEHHIERWNGYSGTGRPLEMVGELTELSLSLAISGLLGLDPGEQNHRVRHALDLWGKHGLSPSVTLLPYDLPLFPYRRFRMVAEELEDEFHRVIALKRARGLGGDALSILLRARDEHGDVLSDTDVLGHLTTFFTAGHETTASALTWTLFLLAQHPDVYRDLVDELHGVLRGAAPTHDQLGDLPLLGGVINEGLRMFSPSMWLLRTTTDSCTLGSYTLPAHTHVVFSPAVTHYDEEIYDQPHRFMPRRWETLSPSPYEYLPFGAGPRRCLGATFAIQELHLAIAIIVQRFRLAIPDGTRVDRGGTILSTPRHGLPVTLYPHDRHIAPTRVRGNVHALVHLDR